MSGVSTLISWNFPSTGAAVYLACPRAARRLRGQSRRSSDAADADVLHLGVFQDTVFRTSTPDTAFLDAAERRHLGGDEPGVQSDDAVFERFADAPRAREVARVHVRG